MTGIDRSLERDPAQVGNDVVESHRLRRDLERHFPAHLVGSLGTAHRQVVVEPTQQLDPDLQHRPAECVGPVRIPIEVGDRPRRLWWCHGEPG